MALAAPALFSTTTGWPSRGASFSATTRAMASVPPPAANGTTRVTARLGQFCAAANVGKSRVVTVRPIAPQTFTRRAFTCRLPEFSFLAVYALDETWQIDEKGTRSPPHYASRAPLRAREGGTRQ